jgi:UDP-glucose:(heptosyl)LPS alpha-1,3-glucosyltransferase
VNVALVVERFAAGAGGVENVAWNLAREIATRDVRTTVVCRAAHGTPSPGIEVRRVRAPGLWQPLRVLAFSRGAARATRSGFDVVHSLARTVSQDIYRTGGGSHASYMEAVYASPRTHALLSPRHRVLLRIEERVFADPRQIIQCNARGTAVDISRRFGVPEERLCVIYNGVDTDRFHPERRMAARSEVRRSLGLGGPAALFVGAGFRRKGLDRAIEGLARGAPPDAVLLVVGGDDPRPWRELATRCGVVDRVRFLGRRGDVDRLQAAADLFVLPTRYDPFSNACLEAMASGLPVATTPANGASELIDPGRSGLVLDERFEEGFALLAEPDRLEAMGRVAHGTARDRSWARHAEEVLALYARVGP